MSTRAPRAHAPEFRSALGCHQAQRARQRALCAQLLGGQQRSPTPVARRSRSARARPPAATHTPAACVMPGAYPVASGALRQRQLRPEQAERALREEQGDEARDAARHPQDTGGRGDLRVVRRVVLEGARGTPLGPTRPRSPSRLRGHSRSGSLVRSQARGIDPETGQPLPPSPWSEPPAAALRRHG